MSKLLKSPWELATFTPFTSPWNFHPEFFHFTYWSQGNNANLKPQLRMWQAWLKFHFNCSQLNDLRYILLNLSSFILYKWEQWFIYNFHQNKKPWTTGLYWWMLPKVYRKINTSLSQTLPKYRRGRNVSWPYEDSCTLMTKTRQRHHKKEKNN